MIAYVFIIGGASLKHVRKELDIFGRKLVVEIGKVAKQAAGSCLISFGDTVLLTTACAEKTPKSGQDFMPLTVDYVEKFYAAGKIPGGFMKREGKPSENATLSARLIDRPIRPLFEEGYSNETQVTVTVLSVDPDNSPEEWGIMGASVALCTSPIPFSTPVAGVNVAYKDGEYIIEPNQKEIEEADLFITVAGTEDAVAMVEGEAKEASEEIMLGAITAAHEAIKKLVSFQKEIIEEINPTKWEIEPDDFPQEYYDKLENLFNKTKDEFIKALTVKEKLERADKVKEYRNGLFEKILEEVDDEDKDLVESKLKGKFEELHRDALREYVIKNNRRIDGRALDEIRPITCEIGVLPRTHGSAIFTRGETQSLGIVTLGMGSDVQIVDTLMEDGSKDFMLHYNFPKFSTGEVGRNRGPGRREIGHGHLAERAVKAIVPKDDFPYTIRVVSEILESNGSSSMATVCSASLSLMDAGVPVKEHVAGIAMGLIMEGDEVRILTDILGDEDHYGDMDFKVAGTRKGITAFQMDVKVSGISEEVMKKALEQAKKGREHILGILENTIEKPRDHLSKYAPRIEVMHIAPDKIGDLIGPGGKTIRGIIEKAGLDNIDTDPTGEVRIAASDSSSIEKAKSLIIAVTARINKGDVFEAVVKRVEKYGVFLEIAPGKTALMHVSKFLKDAPKPKLGDTIKIIIDNVDRMGKISAKPFVKE